MGHQGGKQVPILREGGLVTQPGPQAHPLARKDRQQHLDRQPTPQAAHMGGIPYGKMAGVGGFGQDWGGGVVLSQPKWQMSALAFCVRVVQSEQNKHGAGFLRPRAQPNQGLQPRARLWGQENRGVRQTGVPASSGSSRRAANRL